MGTITSPRSSSLKRTIFSNANATLINGKGRYAGGPASNLSVIRAQPGLRHRMRFINMACENAFHISIDNHKMTIIEVDGIETEPLEVDILPIANGQRFSVVVNMDQPVDNYCEHPSLSLY